MQFKFSRCFAYQTPDVDKAIKFYRDVIGLELVENTAETIEFRAGQFRFFLDKGPTMGPIMELVVADLEAGKAALLEAGCQVDRGGGKGRPCYMKDPFGLLFNVFEETEA